jgi:hypothetical protein
MSRVLISTSPLTISPRMSSTSSPNLARSGRKKPAREKLLCEETSAHDKAEVYPLHIMFLEPNSPQYSLAPYIYSTSKKTI